MDVFDEEDLLAIANDGGSSSSGGDGSDASSSSDSDVVDTNEVGDGCASEAHIEKTSAAAVTTPNNHARDHDSDSSDGGFLDSWLNDMKKDEDDFKELDEKDVDDSEPTSEKTDNNHLHIASRNGADVGLDEGPSAGESLMCVIDDQMNKKTKDSTGIKLGASVLEWISTHNSKKRKAENLDLKTGALVGIQCQMNVPDEGKVPSELVMELKKERGHKSAFFESADEPASESKRLRGDVISCASMHDRRKSNAMVDCLARYDEEQKCYILEMVEWNLSPLQPYTYEDTGDNAASPYETGQAIADPRLLAKRADAQVKKLKKAKRKSVGEESNPKTKVKTGDSAKKLA